MFSTQASFGTLRSVTPGSIGAAYASFAVLPGTTVAITFKNQTDGDVHISTDGVTDHLIFPANSYGTYDIKANSPTNEDLFLRKSLTLFAKDGATAPTTGTFWVESLIVSAVS